MTDASQRTTSTTRRPAEEMRWDRDMATGTAPMAYERHLVPGLFRPSAETLLDVVAPKPDDRVLDVGCGTGIVALLAAQRIGPSGTVSGVDLNPSMLEVARSLPDSERVEWRQGDATALPCPDAGIDLVYSQHALQFVPDRSQALKEIHRVLTPGGRTAIAVWGPVERAPGYMALGAALERHVAPEAGAAVRAAPFSLSDADELSSLLEQAGFREVDVRSIDLETQFPSAAQFLAGVLPLIAAVVPAAVRVDESQRRALFTELSGELAPYQTEGRLAFPMLLHVGTGRAG